MLDSCLCPPIILSILSCTKLELSKYLLNEGINYTVMDTEKKMQKCMSIYINFSFSEKMMHLYMKGQKHTYLCL